MDKSERKANRELRMTDRWKIKFRILKFGNLKEPKTRQHFYCFNSYFTYFYVKNLPIAFLQSRGCQYGVNPQLSNNLELGS